MAQSGMNMNNANLVAKILKKIATSLIIYAFGYMHLSIIWILLPMILDTIREKHLVKRLRRRNLVRKLTSSDEKEVLESFSDLPAWVCFPDMERVEWVNKVIKQLWPNVNSYVHDIIKTLLETKLNKKLGKYRLSGLVFKKMVVGIVPFRIGGVVVYENVSRNEIVCDLDVSYAGDCDISLKLGKMKGGIKDFQLYGRLRVIIKPLINTLPLAGGLQVFFLNPPEIDFSLDGLGGVLEIPGLNELLKKLILETICSVIVLPNKYPIKLSKVVSKQDIEIPNPRGVLRFHVVQARKLMKKDLTIAGKLTSDPYAVLTIGNQEFRTPTRERTARPKWDFWCEFVIEEIYGQFVFITVWDKDTIEDEPLGRTKIQVSRLVERGQTDMWFNLEEARHGQVQIRSTWLSLSTNDNDLKETLYEIQHLQVTTLSAAILTIFVDSANNIISAKSSSKIQPYVYVQLGKQEKLTKTFDKQIDPVWEEGFTFLVQNPETDYVTFKVIDVKEQKVLGEFIYNISILLGEDSMQADKQSFKLCQCENEARINLSLNLKILKNECSKNMESPDSRHSDSTEQIKCDNIEDPELSEHSSLSRSPSSSSSSEDSDNASIKSDILSPAKIKLTLRYSVQRQRLIVVVHHIEDLHFDESKGLYVKLYLLPERHKDTKRKTQVIRTSKNPVYDETFEFVISQDELSNKHLEVSVMEEKVLKNEAIEKVVIDLDKLSLVLAYTRLFRLFTKSHQS